MITATNSVLAEAGAAIYEISEEEHLRQQLEAREDALRTERDVQKQFERVEKERDAAIAEWDATTAKLDVAIALLKKHGNDPAEAE